MAPQFKQHIKRCVKFLLSIYSLGANLTSASYSSMLLDLEHLNQTEIQPNLDRLFSGKLEVTLATINRYGCWCYLDLDFGRGKGKPVNDLDKICQTLAHGYKCAMMDVEEDPYFLDGVDIRDEMGTIVGEAANDSEWIGDPLPAPGKIYEYESEEEAELANLRMDFEEAFFADFQAHEDRDDFVDAFETGESVDLGIKKSSAHRYKRSEQEGTSCIPWNETYRSVVRLPIIDNGQVINKENIYQACQAENPTATKCAILSCAVEGHFIIQLTDLFLSGYAYDDYFSHNNEDSDFDPRDTCKGDFNSLAVDILQNNDSENQNSAGEGYYSMRPQTGRDRPDEDTSYECCGKYPKRFPYRPNFREQRGCCGQKTFSKSKLKCCANDVLRYSCD